MSPPSLTFTTSGWNTAQTVTVTGVQDTVDDGTVTWAVRLDPSSGDAGYDGLDNEDVPVSTTDDDPLPTVSLVLSDSSISEEDGVSTVTARLSGASSEAVTVTVAAAAGTGAVAADFILSTKKTLTIAAGATASTGTVTVTANGNDVDSPNKSVTVSGMATGGNGVANPPNVTLTLEDDDALPTVSLVLSDSSISEERGVSTVTARLSHPSSWAVTVRVAAGPVSLRWRDFGLSVGRTLTIAAGATASTGAVTVTARGNRVDAPDKSVIVSGTATGGNGVANPPNVTLTLEDDDALPTVSLVLSDSSISEEGGVSTVTAVLAGFLRSSEAVTVTVAVAAGTGAMAADFSLSTARTLTIAAGRARSTGTVTVTANGNNVDSLNKTVTVSGTATGGNGVADPSNATLTLEDDDGRPRVSLVLSDSSVSETGGVATVMATLSHPTSVGPVTVTVVGTASTGAMAADFSLSTARTLTIAAGATTSMGPVTVTANGDDVDSPDKSVVVWGTAAGGNGVAHPSNVILTLTDDDTAGIVVSPSTSATSRLVTTESGGTATFAVELDSEPTGNVVLAAASADTDEGTAAPSALTFTPSDWDEAQTVTLTGVDDSPPAADGSRNYTATLTVNQADTRDSKYDALSALTVYARNRDNDYGLDVGAVSGQATEAGGRATFAVALLARPSAAVTVAVTGRERERGDRVAAVADLRAFGLERGADGDGDREGRRHRRRHGDLGGAARPVERRRRLRRPRQRGRAREHHGRR